jgi:SAM-dependent methyltransferase
MSSVDDLTAARYARMRWNTPLSKTHAALLLQRLDIAAGTHVVDLGCGWGEL